MLRDRRGKVTSKSTYAGFCSKCRVVHTPYLWPRRSKSQGLRAAVPPASGPGMTKRSNASKCDLTNDERRCESSFRSGLPREARVGDVGGVHTGFRGGATFALGSGG